MDTRASPERLLKGPILGPSKGLVSVVAKPDRAAADSAESFLARFFGGASSTSTGGSSITLALEILGPDSRMILQRSG
jgi:hypothetical protein